MLQLGFPSRRPINLLCIGAHSDDLEIGCMGTVLEWRRRHGPMNVTWVVLSADGPRAAEAKRSAAAVLRGQTHQIVVGDFRDGFMPAQYVEVKTFFEDLKNQCARPDVILTHRRGDAHQDHRLAAELTWQTWRDQLVLEYEIPKFEGDLMPPNAFVPLSASIAKRKIAHLLKHFATQRSRAWFSAQTFTSLMQLRGIEARAPSGYAEAFHASKIVL